MGLVAAGVHIELLRAADADVADAWAALANYTGLSGDALIHLVADDDEHLDDTVEMEALR